MIRIENVEVCGFEAAARGMRNPMNSWGRSDSVFIPYLDDGSSFGTFAVGEADLTLMKKLAKGGPVHAKYRRMIVVSADITAPLYWWKEYDTYKVGTVANSCSTMHKIADKEFTLEDFSHEHLEDLDINPLKEKQEEPCMYNFLTPLKEKIHVLNLARKLYLQTGDKKYWWIMIQLLPTSYNQRRTVMLNYEVLAGIYPMRKDHKLDEWQKFCKWIETLPHSEIITLKEEHDAAE